MKYIILLLSIICINTYAASPDDVWSSVNGKLHERYNYALQHESEAWVLDFADSLESVDKIYTYHANLIRSFYAYQATDSVLFFKSTNKLLDIAKKNEYWDDYFDNLSSVVAFSLNIDHIYLAQKMSRTIIDEAHLHMNYKGLVYGYLSLVEIYTKEGDIPNAINFAMQAAKNADHIDDEPDVRLHFKVVALELMLNAYRLQNSSYLNTMRIGEELLKLKSDDVLALLVMGYTSFQAQDYKSFRSYYRRLLAINNPGTDQYPVSLALLRFRILDYASKGQTDEAISLCDDLTLYGEVQQAKIDVYVAAHDWEDAFRSQSELRHYNDSVFSMANDHELKGMMEEMDTVSKSILRDRKQGYLRFFIFCIILILVFSTTVYISLLRRKRQLATRNLALAKSLKVKLELQNRLEKEYNELALKRKAEQKDQEQKQAHKVKIERFVEELSTKRLYTNSNFDRNQLLEKYGIPKRTFIREFEAIYGIGFSDYLQNLRVELAAVIIKAHPEYTVEYIARECGIPSPVTFYRRFLGHFGISPSAYRDYKLS